MSEGPPKSVESKKPGREGWVREESAKLKIEKIVALAKELAESHEGFPFPGIEPEAYIEKVKADIASEKDMSLYDISSPTIDELIERFKIEGMKVVLGKYPENGIVHILPTQSNDIQSDNIPPKYLQISEGMNEKLRELILLSRS